MRAEGSFAVSPPANRRASLSSALTRQLRERLTNLFEELVGEFESRQFGTPGQAAHPGDRTDGGVSPLGATEGQNSAGAELAADWKVAGLALEYTRTKYAEPVYAKSLPGRSGSASHG